MKKTDKIPVVFGENARPSQQLSKEELHTTGTPFANYSISEGEVIDFPETEEDIVTRKQPVYAGGTAMQRLLMVDRIGKDGKARRSWLSLGVLNRLDAKNNPTCDFCAEMNQYECDWDRIIALLGKKITCKSSVTRPFQKFDPDTRQRLAGQTEDRPTPVIEYA